jgi:hypothetical protein
MGAGFLSARFWDPCFRKVSGNAQVMELFTPLLILLKLGFY